MSDFPAEPDRQDLLAAALAEHHLIEEELGRGGSATVYLAQDLRHGRRVALKVLHSALGAALGVERRRSLYPTPSPPRCWTADSVFAAAVDAIRPSSFDGDTARYHLLRAEASAYRGDSAAARAHADSARALLESQVRERPDDAKLLARTGVALARAGRKADAIRAGRRAAALLPPSRDATPAPSC